MTKHTMHLSTCKKLKCFWKRTLLCTLPTGAMVNSASSSPRVSSRNFSSGNLKSFLGPVAVGNNLVMRDIMISEDDEEQMFSKLMDILKWSLWCEYHGGTWKLCMVSNVGSIISNDYAVQAELSCKLAKQVHCYCFTPIAVAATLTLTITLTVFHLLLWKLSSNKVVFMTLRGANQVTELYPKEFKKICTGLLPKHIIAPWVWYIHPQSIYLYTQQEECWWVH